jgi:hypothetical protein
MVKNDVLESVSGYLKDIKVKQLKITKLGRDLFHKNEMPSTLKQRQFLVTMTHCVKI